MKLTAEQIFAVSLGAMQVSEQEGVIQLHRFNREQEELYMEAARLGQRGVTLIPNKVHSTAGVELRFRTDSPSLLLDLEIRKGSGRTFFALEVFADGKPVGALENHSGKPLPAVYSDLPFEQGNFRKSFDLGPGTKEVRVLLPWSAWPLFHEISLADGASLEPVKPGKTLLAYGDSITHGYDALWPSHCYPVSLADALGACQHNRAMGGETFFPELARAESLESPDYITVAYGTNDWVKTTEETAEKCCREFYAALSRKYPAAKIFALTPIWREAWRQPGKGFGPWERMEQIIEETAAALPNVTVIRGFDLVPHTADCFADDLVLHPNDRGFAHYAENLIQAVKKAL